MRAMHSAEVSMQFSRKTTIKSVKGTVCFIRNGQDLMQGYDITLANSGGQFGGQLQFHWSAGEHQEMVSVAKGESTIRVWVPDLREAQEVQFRLICPDGVAEFPHDHKPMRHWTVHLIQFAHHDPGYTDLPSNVLREYCGFYDDILRFCTETDHFPDESRFRYTIEQGWSLLHYLDHRPPEVREEMMRRIREGRIEVNAFLGNQVTELQGPEEMVRMLYPVFELKRKYGIPVTTAEHNDVPGISWGVAAAMAGSGIRYFAPALPDYFRWGEKYHTFWDERKIAPNDVSSVFFWEAPDGERILFYYGRQGAGGQVDVTLRDFPSELERLEETDYPYDVFRYIVMGGWRDNSPPRVEFAYTCREWNSKYAYPRLEQSLNSRFFPALEKQLKPGTPVYRGELPATDYSVGATCTAYASSLNRTAHDWLLSAERIAALASAVPVFRDFGSPRTDRCARVGIPKHRYQYPADTISEAYYCTLMNDEHAWGLAHPIGPAHEACIAQHCEYGYRAAALAHDVLMKAVNELADHVTRDEDGCYALVFNPLDRARTDLAVAPARPMDPCSRPMARISKDTEKWEGRPLPLAAFPVSNRDMVHIPMDLIENGFEVIDVSTGKTVPHEVFEVTDPLVPVPYAGYRHAIGQYHHDEKYDVRFIAEDVPALGYKVYRFTPRSGSSGAPRSRTSAASRTSNLENRFYRVELDRETGVIKSIFDKGLNRELLDKTCEHGANQMVLRSSITSETFTSGKATIEQGRTGPVSASLIVKTTAPGYPRITQEIILYSDLKRIDIANRVLKDSTPQLETFFAFPWALEKPKFMYEGSLSVIEPLVDQFPGSNSEYYAIQHWADVSDGKAGVTMSSIDAAMMQFGGNWPLYVSQAHHGFTPPNFDHPFHTKKDVKKGWMYSLALVNNFRTNFSPTQSGDLLFRYSITSHEGDWKKGRARDFGYGVSLPLVHAGVQGNHQGELPSSSGFCTIDRPNVLLVTLKRAEDGRGFIVRLLETEGKGTEVTVTLPFLDIAQAMETNLVEEDQRIIPNTRQSIRLSLRAWGTGTARVTGAEC